jgi:flagellar basal body-associated protein FliL
MGDPGNPTDGGTPPEPDPDQPGWASPNPPETPPPAAPPPPSPEPTQPNAPAWGTTPPAATPPPPPTAPQATAPAWGTPPPAAPGPPAGTPGWSDPGGPPPKKRRLTWLWLLIPLMLVFVAATVVVVVFGVKLFTEPVDATNDFYADLSAARYEEAYAQLCTPAQRAFSEAQFVQNQERTEQTQGRISRYNFDNVEFSNTDDDFESDVIDATVKGTITREGREFDVVVGLQHEDGEWRVCASANR